MTPKWSLWRTNSIPLCFIMGGQIFAIVLQIADLEVY